MSFESAAPAPSVRAFSYPSYRFFWGATALTSFSAQIMAVAVALQVYLLTRDPFMLGLVGLATFLPALSLVLVTGLVADRFNRRRIMPICIGIELICAAVLFLYARASAGQVWPVFLVLVFKPNGLFGTTTVRRV